MTGPIDAFLAELGRLLRGGAEERSRVAAEVGDHLRDLAAEARARGLGDLDAESEAVERFGSPRALARGLQPSRRPSRRAQVALSLMLAGACAGLAFAVLRSPGQGAKAQIVTLRPAWGTAEPVAQVIAIDPRTGTVLALPTVLRRTSLVTAYPGTMFTGGIWPPGLFFARDSRYTTG